MKRIVSVLLSSSIVIAGFFITMIHYHVADAAGLRAGMPVACGDSNVCNTGRRRLTPAQQNSTWARQALHSVFGQEEALYNGLRDWIDNVNNPPYKRAFQEMTDLRAKNSSNGVKELRALVESNKDSYLKDTGIQTWVIAFNPPQVLSFNPKEGIAGDSIVLYGKNFTDVTTVTVNGRETAFTVVTSEQIKTQLPDMAGGLQLPIVVETRHGKGQAKDLFRQWAGECDDRNITRAIGELFQKPPRGEKKEGQCDPTLYGNYETYSDLLTKIQQRYGYTKRDAPVIDSVFPNSGGPGTKVRIEGKNLYQVKTVLFNNHVAQFDPQSDWVIIATVPNDGAGEIIVSTFSGTARWNKKFIVQSAPDIDSFSPDNAFPGDILTIKGKNLQNTSQVLIGSTSISTIIQISPEEIAVKIPAGTRGGSVAVVTPGGKAEYAKVTVWTEPCRDPWITQAIQELLLRKPYGQGDVGECDIHRYNNGHWNNYKEIKWYVQQQYGYNPQPAPTISRIDPSSAVAGDYVTIYGDHFDNLQVVIFGSNASDDTQMKSSTEIRAKVPFGAGSGEVTVSTRDGVARYQGFGISYPPNISNVEPVSGEPGDTVHLNGTNLNDVTQVMFLGKAVTPTNKTDRQITLVIPDVSGNGSIKVVSSKGESSWGPFTVSATKNALGNPEYCFGAVGKGCNGDGSVEWGWGSQKVLKPVGCSQENAQGWRACWVAAGSIRHDNCCVKYPSGKMCGGPGVHMDNDWFGRWRKGDPDGKPADENNHDGHCVQEWDAAWWDVFWGRAWPMAFNARVPGDLTPVHSSRYALEHRGTQSICAPGGQEMREASDAAFCCSGRVDGTKKCLPANQELANGQGATVVASTKGLTQAPSVDLVPRDAKGNLANVTPVITTSPPLTATTPLISNNGGALTPNVGGALNNTTPGATTGLTATTPFTSDVGGTLRSVQGLKAAPTNNANEQGVVIPEEVSGEEPSPAPAAPPAPVSQTTYCDPNLPTLWQPGCVDRPSLQQTATPPATQPTSPQPTSDAPTQTPVTPVHYCDPDLPKLWQPGCIPQPTPTVNTDQQPSKSDKRPAYCDSIPNFSAPPECKVSFLDAIKGFLARLWKPLDYRPNDSIAATSVVGTYRCWKMNVGGAGASCRLSPPIILRPDGTYDIAKEHGTYELYKNRIRLSESKIRGIGTISDGNKIMFAYDYKGWHQTVTYLRQTDSVPPTTRPTLQQPIAQEQKEVEQSHRNELPATVDINLTLIYPADLNPSWVNTVTLVPHGFTILSAPYKPETLALWDKQLTIHASLNDVRTGTIYTIYAGSGREPEAVGTLDLRKARTNQTITIMIPDHSHTPSDDPSSQPTTPPVPPALVPMPSSPDNTAPSAPVVSPSTGDATLPSSTTQLPPASQHCNPLLPHYRQPGCIESPADDSSTTPPPTKLCNPLLPHYAQPGCVKSNNNAKWSM